MSVSVKQRRLTSKAIVSIAIAVISILAIAVGALTIFALNQVSFNSSVKISYQAKDIAGKVTMYAKAAPKASNYTAKVDSEKIGEFEFTPTTDTTENPAEINMDDVELDSTDNALYLHYYFENAGTRAYTAILNYNLTDIITNQNMTLEYSESGAEGSYKNANSGLVVPGNGTKDYFVKISVTDLGLDADFEGMFTWQLNECDDSLTAMEEISLTATEFTIISEEDNTYSAKYNGGDISVTNVSGAGELSAQENTIENIWYVPARIGTGRVISIVNSGCDENWKPIQLPANTKVVIANGVGKIDDCAFSPNQSGCGIVEIEIPNSVISIGQSAFERCTSLTSIDIPNSVTSIGGWVFNWCTGLISINIPNSVTSIGDSAFYGCTSLTSIVIPNSVTNIVCCPFSGCDKLVEIYNLSEELFTAVDFGVSADTIIHTNINEPSVVHTDTNGFQYFEYETGKYKLLGYVGEDTEITIPSSYNNFEITEIRQSAFYNCTSLTSIEIPDSITSIGNSTFYNCTSLTSIEIPNSVISIGSYAFQYCTKLTSVTFKTTSGWKRYSSSTATSGTTLSSTGLANTNTAATWLTSTYQSYYWKRT